MWITGTIGQEVLSRGVYAVHVGDGWLLTVASAFADYQLTPPPAPAQLLTLQVASNEPPISLDPSCVVFHPDAWPGHQTHWDSPLPANLSFPDAANADFDLALIPSPATNLPVAKLWHPADPAAQAQLLLQSTVTVAANQTGEETVVALDGGRFRGDMDPSGLKCVTDVIGPFPPNIELCDMGGAAFIPLANGFAGSVPLVGTCMSETPGGIGDTVLAGIAQGSQPHDQFVQLFRPQTVEWVAEIVADNDDDDVCDDSDNCVKAYNPGQENCNADAEVVKGVAPVGDACDQVPCVRAAQTSVTGGGGLLEFTTNTRFDVEPVRIDGASEFEGAWGHRVCDCPSANGTPTAPLQCHLVSGCTISQGAFFALNGPDWIHTEVGLKFAPPPAVDATFVHVFAPPAELQPGGVAATLETLVWHPPGGGAFGVTTTGSHWFHVKNDACSNPILCPVIVPQQTLDDLASHYWAGQAGTYVSINEKIPEVPQSFSWWSPPVPDCPMCGTLEVLPFAHLRPDDILAMRTPAGDYEIESQLTPIAVQTLKQASGVQWLAPVEPAQLLFDVPVRLASIADDGSAAGPALRSTAAGIDLVQPRAGSPAPRAEFGAVLRATESDLFVIGGVFSNGQVAGDVWRYPILAGDWELVSTDAQIVPGAVLAATYDAYQRRLLVLDELGSAPNVQARLWSLDPASGRTHLFGAWPRAGFYGAFALGHAHDGSFVLLAGKTHGVALKVLRFVLTDSDVEIEGVRTTTGTPVAPPRTNQRGIHIMVRRPAKQIVGDRIDWSALQPPSNKTIGDYVK